LSTIFPRYIESSKINKELIESVKFKFVSKVFLNKTNSVEEENSLLDINELQNNWLIEDGQVISQNEENKPLEKVNHPNHYGGENNVYEAIKIIEAHDLNFVEGNVIKYLLRYKKKNGYEDLEKALWYMVRLVENHKK
jgi:hypothetical protein